MTSILIEPSIDAYGRYAEASAIADFLELWALAGVRVNPATLGDYLADNDWQISSRLVQGGAAEEQAEEDLAEAEAMEVEVGRQIRDVGQGDVFNLLIERAEILGDVYPFTVEDSGLVDRGFEPITSHYVLYLCLTTSHAYAVPVPTSPVNMFEDLVAGVLTARHLLGVNFGRVARAAADFETALTSVGPNLRLEPTPEAVSRKIRAQDHGVDTIGHLWWGDSRVGAWTMIGQATCAKSEAWENKLQEPKAFAWKGFLGIQVLPQVFLAVPHHVEPNHLLLLSEHSGHLILDRLRLVPFTDTMPDGAEDLIRAVLDADLATP